MNAYKHVGESHNFYIAQSNTFSWVFLSSFLLYSLRIVKRTFFRCTLVEIFYMFPCELRTLLFRIRTILINYYILYKVQIHKLCPLWLWMIEWLPEVWNYRVLIKVVSLKAIMEYFKGLIKVDKSEPRFECWIREKRTIVVYYDEPNMNNAQW